MAVSYSPCSLLFQQEQPEAPEEKAESVPDEPVEEAKLSSDSSVQTSQDLLSHIIDHYS